MAEMVKLEAELRTVTGKKVKQLRAQNLIPAVIYGQKIDSAVHVQIRRDVLRQVLRAAGATNLIEISAGNQTYNVLVREVQRDVLSGDPLHVDFYSVALDTRLSAEVPVVTVGESPVVASGEAMLITPNTIVEIEALPTNIPSELELDISKLTEPGTFLTVSDLELPEGVTLLSDADLVLARTELPRREEVEEVEEEDFFAEEVSAEPEVIKRGKEEDEEEE
ncbi:MAG: 50S ribosomal protein L25/general stress protein Ctc [Anaerolineae bacterium]